MSSVSEKIRELTLPILKRKGFELVDLQYRKEGKDWVLRLLIDHPPEGVTLANCQEVSEELDAELEHADIIEHPYLLEVASPGIDRPLVKTDDYIRFAGKRVKLKTFRPVSGRRNFRGILKGYENDEILIESEGQIYRLPYKQIARANLDPEISF